MKKKKSLSLLLGLILILNIIVISNVKVQAAGTTISYSLSSSSIYAGDVFSIYVNAQGVSGLYGASIDTAFNSSMLEVQSIKKVDLLNSFTEVTGLNNLPGIRSYAAVLTGANSGVTGSGKVFQIVVKAKAAGTVVLKTINSTADQLSASGNNVNIKLADNNSNPITYTSSYYTINIKQSGKWVQNSNGTWSYLNAAGNKTIGWFLLANKWYYFDSNGIMKTAWQLIGGKWYYFGGASDGVMKTGWQSIGGKRYYFDSSGAMKTGWLKYGSDWYYLTSSGAMKTGWLQLGADWYYLYTNGIMAHDTVIDGKYKIGSDGRWIQ